MDRDHLVRLRQQLDTAIECDTPEARNAIAKSLREALKRVERMPPAVRAHGDALGCALQAMEDTWLKGAPPPALLPGGQDHQARLSHLLSDILAVQSFALSISRGDLSRPLKAKGVVAGSFKALQGSLRHLTWQTRMIEQGDFSQHVDFMGEFSESFNSMVEGLAQARDQIRRHSEALEAANASLTAEISERRRAEQALRNARDTLEERVKERTDALSRSNESLMAEIAERRLAERALAWANHELSDFAFIASHHLQEPLRKIQVFCDLFKVRTAHALSEKEKDLLERIRASAERMGNQIDSLYDYADHTRKAVPFRPVALNRMVGDTLSVLDPQIRETQATIEVSDLPSIEADPGQVFILFKNLIANALKFHGERNPVIRIYNRPFKTEETPGNTNENRRFSVFVEDNGIGFDEKYLDRIFKPFQVLQRDESAYGGTGMGLTICKKIVERHNGEITARSRPGQGATFIVTLPVRQTDNRSEVQGSEVQRFRGSEVGRRSGEPLNL